MTEYGRFETARLCRFYARFGIDWFSVSPQTGVFAEYPFSFVSFPNGMGMGENGAAIRQWRKQHEHKRNEQ